ncbi:MAG TPA: OmpA family protein [Kofleriaceae bacterium]|nr:OmpA family protein [Kofleriaceae bacterium]
MAISVPDASGILVRPPQKGARGVSRAEVRPKPQRGKKLAMIVIGSALAIGIAGGVGAYLSAGGDGPSPRPAAQVIPGEAERTKLERELVETRDALAVEKKQADELRAEKAKTAAKAAEAAKEREKLAAVVGGQGAVSGDGEEISLELVDKVLFQVGEAELTPRGKDVLTRVGAALNDVPDKQIWVQGHTDDSPIRPAKGVTPKFATNWELSSARALTVVHYLQNDAKVDPRRLAAVAFGQYRPASRAKAKNRRIEIVLYPKHQLAR